MEFHCEVVCSVDSGDSETSDWETGWIRVDVLRRQMGKRNGAAAEKRFAVPLLGRCWAGWTNVRSLGTCVDQFETRVVPWAELRSGEVLVESH